MASVQRRDRNGKVSWRAMYRDPTGDQKSKSFPRRIDAERFLTKVESSKLAGAYVSPDAGRVTVGEWSELWLAGKVNLKASSRERYAMTLRVHVEPRWGRVRICDVGHAQVQAWITELTTRLSPSSVRKAHQMLLQVLQLAVKDGRLARNVAKDVDLPRMTAGERRYLTHAQVAELAEACSDYGVHVLFLAYTGVRFGEMAALRVADLDLMRRRATIARSVTAVHGRHAWSTPKGHEPREVPIPRFLVDQLAEHVAGRSQDSPAFPTLRGLVLRNGNFRTDVFEPACAAVGLDGLTPHGLRHTAASLAIAAGANVKVVQQMLGHKTATMTLDLYGHLFPDQLDDVADALDRDARAAAVAPPLPTAPVVDLASVRQVPAAQ